MSSPLTNIYHIAYTPELKEICLFFWGCNIECKGCYCKRRIYSPMLKDFLGKHIEEPSGIAPAPERFLTMDELTDILDNYDFNSVVLEGQEAGLDPLYLQITQMLHERYHSFNVLLSNGYQLPDLSHTNKVEIGLKAITESMHKDYTGISNTQVLANIRKLHRDGTKFFIETCYIPGYIDIDELEKIAKFIVQLDPDILFVILPYFKSGDNPWRRPTIPEMDQAAAMAKTYLTNVFHFKGDEELKYEVFSAFPEGIDQPATRQSATLSNLLGGHESDVVNIAV